MSIRSQNKPSAEFSTSTIADIVFLLLIYFLLTSTFVTQVGIKVDLPRSTSEQPSTAKHSVTIDKDGNHYWDNRLMESRDGLPSLIEEVLTNASQEDDVITLRTDREVTMDEAAFVMSAIQEHGGKVVIQTRKK